MPKKYLIVLLFVLMTGSAYSAGGGGTGGGDKEKPVSQYEIAAKMIKKAKKFEKKNKIDKAQKQYKKAIGYLLKHNKKYIINAFAEKGVHIYIISNLSQYSFVFMGPSTIIWS